MVTFFAAISLAMVMFGFMAFALWFSKYKQNGRTCCNTGIDELDSKLDPCISCPRKDSEECDHESGEMCDTKNAAGIDACALEAE